jgi:magnesium transporter
MLHGIAIGAVAAVVAYGVGGSPLLGLVVMLALFFNLTFACTAGTLIPLGLRALGLDPALASSIFLTMVTDVAGFFFLLGLGTLLLP